MSVPYACNLHATRATRRKAVPNMVHTVREEGHGTDRCPLHSCWDRPTRGRQRDTATCGQTVGAQTLLARACGGSIRVAYVVCSMQGVRAIRGHLVPFGILC